MFWEEFDHETVGPATPDYDDVTLTLDLSPQSYFDDLSMAKAHQNWVDGLLSDFDAAEADTLIRHLDGLSGRIRNGGSRA